MPGASRFTQDWLALREGADAAARSSELVDPLRKGLLNRNRVVIRDLGCGTASLGRWLAGRLPGPQHWILHDRDRELLERASASMTGVVADGSPVTVETRHGDLTALRAEDLVGTSLVAASALLDLLTFDEVDDLAAACVAAGCPALLTLSVAGKVEFSPAEPLDAEFTTAFNAHQRRSTGGRRLLGPDAVAATTEAFARRGAQVHTRPSPWRLSADDATLIEEWLRGWVAAACEQRQDLAPEADAYLRRKLEGRAAGASDVLEVTVHHIDLLALPARIGPSS